MPEGKEQVSAAEGTALELGGAGYFRDGLVFGVGVSDAGHEGEIAVVGGLH